jgi:hypothetical protein
MIAADPSVLPVVPRGREGQVDAFSACSTLEELYISGSKDAVDVGIVRSGIALRTLAAACAAAACLSAGAGVALGSSPPPPPPTSGGPPPPPASTSTPTQTTTQTTTTSTATSTTQPPPADTRPPAAVSGLHAITKVPGKITLRWTNPHASDLAAIMIRRGWEICPASSHDGVQVGGTALRTVQVDTGAVDNTRYCYAGFAFDGHGNVSSVALDRSVTNPGDRTAPGPVTGLAVTTNARGQVVVSWHNPQRAGIAFDTVRRGVYPSCPRGPADGSPVGGESVRHTQVDASAKPGVTYCYRVFALDAAGNASVAVPGAHATLPTPAARHAPAPSRAAHGARGSGLSSTLVRAVAIAGFLVLLATAFATVMTRRRMHSTAYLPAARGQFAPARQFGPRVAMTASGPGALVIPALAVLGCSAAIALVLLNL